MLCCRGFSQARSAVHFLDDGLEVLHHLGPLYLHGRRQVAGRFGEVGRDDTEGLDGLGLGHGGVGLRDQVLHRRLDHGILRRLLQRGAGREPVALQPARQRLLVKGDQGADERPVVTHHQDLRDQRVGTDLVLQQGRDHVLAAGGDDDFLLAAGDPDKAVLVEPADVSGAEPAVVKRVGREVLALVVAAHHADALGEDLAVFGDLDGVTGQGLAHRADLDQGRGVDRNGGGGFGQAVPLEDLHADALEEVAQPFAEGAAAGHGVGHVAAHGCAQLAVDELVEQGVAELQAQADAAGLACLGERDGGIGGPVEDGALAAVLRLGQGRVVDLLEDAGHGQDEGGLVALQVRQQVLDVRRMRHRGPGGHGQDGDEAGKDVCQRQEHDGLGVLVDDFADDGQGVVRELHEVAVRQLAALGPAGGAGGVDDGGDVVGQAGSAPARLELGIADAPPGLAEGIQPVAFQLPDVLQVGESFGGDGLPDDVLVVGGFAECGDGAGVTEVPGHLGR